MSASTTVSAESDAIFLTQEDVERLLREDSPDARINVLDKIASHYASRRFSQREFEYAEQIFRLLMRDAELRVRQKLAEQVKDNPDIPRDIVLHLAEDVEQVSLPVLRSSDVLSDADLIRIIETSREISKLVAIAGRDNVSGRLSQALAETRYPQVVDSLLKNEGADIAPRTYEQILNDFPHEETIAQAMVARSKLPLAIAEKLVRQVSGALAQELKKRHGVPADKLAEQTREQLTLEMLTHDASEEDIAALVRQMMADERLNPSIILSSLCRGHLRFFEAALARLAGIPAVNAQKLIHDKGPLGFQAIYLRTGMPESMFEAVRLLLQVVGSLAADRPSLSRSAYANRCVQLLLERSRGRDIENIPYIIALIRQSAH